jgi:hypothetical protein
MHQVHTATSVNDFLATKGFKTVFHPPYLMDVTPADFCLFPKVVRAGWNLAVPGQLQEDELGRDHAQKMSLSLHFCSDISTATSAFGLAMTTFRKVEQ